MPENPQRAGAVLIDGKGIADETIAKLGRAVATLEVPPLLVVVMVGKQAPSLSYIKRKEAAAAECGIRTRLLQMDEDTEQAALLQAIVSLNDDEDVDGIIVQLPLPPHLDANAATKKVSPLKDVDGFLPANVGSIALHGFEPAFVPCTPKGCLDLIKSVGIPLRGKEAVMVGASNIVGTQHL